MKFGNRETDAPLALAPMAGVTDYAFRTVSAACGASWTVTEMVSSRALIYGDKKSERLLRKNSGSICGAQLFGNDPDVMAEAARIACERSGCDFLDINMGCPMPKVANSGDGCGLMRTPELAGRIVAAVSRAVDVPTTVKCRLGWDKGSINVLEFARRMEQSGAALIAVHGRTRSMLYSGTADWDAIARVKAALTIPVLANGDIVDAASAQRCKQWTQADGLMIGRAAFGDPWVFQEIHAALSGEPIPPRPPLSARVGMFVRQFELAMADKGEKIACLEARKHFAWYLRGVPYSGYYKTQISAIAMAADVYRIADGVCHDLK